MVLGSFQDVLDAAPGLHGEGPDLHVELPGCGIQVRHVLTQVIVLRQVNKKKVDINIRLFIKGKTYVRLNKKGIHPNRII